MTGLLAADPMTQIPPSIRFVLLAAALAASGGAVQAQEDAPAVPAQPRGGPVELLAGARVGWPQQVSGYVGVALVRKRYENGYAGTSLVVEPGLGAGAVRVGWTTAGGIGMTARAQLSILRTWRDPWVVGPDQTWLGADAQAGFGYVGVAVGAYVRAPTDGAGPAPMLTLNLVLGN
ncbi:MAG TPA: hypothetical protein VHG08_12405 [Longimicrobium sp.]|nr:hypothetical protein [Longimicrobium sp.]